MKQVTITSDILSRLQSAVGDGVDVSKLAVYEAVALNTRPVRKQHPMYVGGTHTRQFLEQMAAAVGKESLPLQIQHNTDPLPVGRIFYGEVIDSPNGTSELRVLFWVDRTNPEIVNLIDNGTVDQVSVSVLPASATCNQCGFDFLGEKATIDNIWTGTCDQGHVMGADGAHVLMNSLNRWFEMSLVGQGGIPGARIVPRASSVLAASGTDLPFLTLTLSSNELEKLSMDLTQLISELTDNKAQVTSLKASETSLKDQLAAAQAALDAAQAEIDTLKAAAAQQPEPVVDEAAANALSDIAKHVLTLAGKATDEPPTKTDDIVALVKSTKLSIASSAAAPADGGGQESITPMLAATAFKRR